MTDTYPFDIQDVDSATSEEIWKHFKGLRQYGGFVRIGPKGYIYPRTPDIKEQMSAIYNMPYRPTDVFVSTFPRSGTTMTQELVWLVANDLNYEAAKSKHLMERYVTLGSYITNVYEERSRVEEYKDRKCSNLETFNAMIIPPTERLACKPEVRFIKNHLPISLLPPDVLDTVKMIYVARDPRDVIVSLYHFSKLLTLFDYVGDFKTYFNIFMKDLIVRTPYFEQVKEAWAKKDHPNMLFLFYEELTQNMPDTIGKICKFLNKQYNDKEIAGLCDHLNFNNFKQNQSVNVDFLKEFGAISSKAEPFVRKGNIGEWRNYFDEEMMEQAKTWMEENLKDTDLKFPQP